MDNENKFGVVNGLRVNVGLRPGDFFSYVWFIFSFFRPPFEKSSEFLRPRSFPP